VPLIGQVLGSDHVGLVYPKYTMNMKDYLKSHRDHDQLPMIIDQLITGV
jgi:hypothetical protein